MLLLVPLATAQGPSEADALPGDGPAAGFTPPCTLLLSQTRSALLLGPRWPTPSALLPSRLSPPQPVASLLNLDLPGSLQPLHALAARPRPSSPPPAFTRLLWVIRVQLGRQLPRPPRRSPLPAQGLLCLVTVVFRSL